MSAFKYGIVTVIIVSLFLSSCKKFLEEKQNQKLVIPTTIQDLQALLDNSPLINRNYPESGELSSDDYFLTFSDWNTQREYVKRTYTWEKDYLFEAGSSNGWAYCYRNIYIANTVLYYTDKINVSINDIAAKNNAKGSAYFFRGICFAQVAYIWGPSYSEETATSDLGIPLRLDPNFNTFSIRSTLKDTYNQIIQDLKEAVDLLPEESIHPVRPSKSAAYGWLARIYLSMQNYDSALVYSSKYLDRHSELMDFNDLSQSATIPISSINKEVIFHTILSRPITTSRIKVDTILYHSYDVNDLRKTIFYRLNSDGTYRFKGSYDGTTDPGNWFNGIATDEIYLVRSECYARKGDIENALTDLNALLVTRWKNNGSWIPITVNSANEALNTILRERRKELTQRGLRWIDIKRLNKEGANIVLRRLLNSQYFTLVPNDPKYALAIPEDVIHLSGMFQNPR